MTPIRRLPALGFALLLLTSCGQSPPNSSEPTAQTRPPQTSSPSAAVSSAPPLKPPVTKPPVVVHIRNFAYVPALVVAVGQPIEIINDDSAAHTWSAAPGAGWTYTSGNLEKKGRATFPGFSRPGRYKFLCYYHAEVPSMNGVATVRETRP